MNIGIYISFSDDQANPELEIYSSAEELNNFGQLLIDIKSSGIIKLPNDPDSFGASLCSLKIELSKDRNQRMIFSVQDNAIIFSGGYSSMKKIGQSLKNFFDRSSVIGEHFHMDRHDGGEVFGDTDFNISFSCDRDCYSGTRYSFINIESPLN